jgi:hypothetical protein
MLSSMTSRLNALLLFLSLAVPFPRKDISRATTDTRPRIEFLSMQRCWEFPRKALAKLA